MAIIRRAMMMFKSEFIHVLVMTASVCSIHGGYGMADDACYTEDYRLNGIDLYDMKILNIDNINR